jgi:hypothetical protein
MKTLLMRQSGAVANQSTAAALPGAYLHFCNLSRRWIFDANFYAAGDNPRRFHFFSRNPNVFRERL